MLKQRLMILIFWLFGPNIIFAGWLGSVYAVCRIELKNGKIIEGTILVGGGGEFRYWRTNGFCYIYDLLQNQAKPDTFVKEILFNTDFYAIQPNEAMVERVFFSGDSLLPSAPENIFGSWFNKNIKEYSLFFMHDITPQGDRTFEIALDSVNDTLRLRRDLKIHIEYELLDYLTIYPDVPEELFLGTKIKSIRPVNLRIKDIKRFELLTNPSQRWLDEISKVETELLKKMEGAEDYELPGWWHKMINEKDEYKKAGYRDVFKKWEY